MTKLKKLCKRWGICCPLQLGDFLEISEVLFRTKLFVPFDGVFIVPFTSPLQLGNFLEIFGSFVLRVIFVPFVSGYLLSPPTPPSNLGIFWRFAEVLFHT
jgi:hypothetical protein